MAPTRLPCRVSRRASTRHELGGHVALALLTRAEIDRGAQVQQEPGGHLAVFGEHAHVRRLHARRDVPVDVAHVVVVLVFAQVRQVQAGAAHQRAVVALQQAVQAADHRPFQAAQHMLGAVAPSRARRRGVAGGRAGAGFYAASFSCSSGLGGDGILAMILLHQRVGGQAFGQRFVRQHQRGAAARRAPGRSCLRAAHSCGRAAWPARARLRSG